jgi:uncharacterized protein (DUF433 family)
MTSDASTHTEYAHIVCTPGVVGGEPRIDGHRIRVRDIVAARDLGGLAPEEIAATVYPNLTLAHSAAGLKDHRRSVYTSGFGRNRLRRRRSEAQGSPAGKSSGEMNDDD